MCKDIVIHTNMGLIECSNIGELSDYLGFMPPISSDYVDYNDKTCLCPVDIIALLKSGKFSTPLDNCDVDPINGEYDPFSYHFTEALAE